MTPLPSNTVAEVLFEKHNPNNPRSFWLRKDLQILLLLLLCMWEEGGGGGNDLALADSL